MPGREARLAEERRLLVARDAGDRDARAAAPRSAVVADRAARGRPRAGSTARGMSRMREQLVVPVAARGCRRAACARRCVTSVTCTAPPVSCQSEPRVDGAEGELAALGALARARDVVQQPRELGAREVRHRARGPVRCARKAASWPACRSASHRDAVRRSCQTMALATGRPVARSQSTRRLALVGDADGRRRRRAARPALRRAPGRPRRAGCARSPAGRARPSPAAGRSGGILAGQRRAAGRRGRRRWRASWWCPGRGREWPSCRL